MEEPDKRNLVLIFYVVFKFYPDQMTIKMMSYQLFIPAHVTKFKVNSICITRDNKSGHNFVSFL